MSIATLKKKTQHQYNNISVGQSNFALNGTRRPQGWIGQTNLSRSIVKTNMKGNHYGGYGGICGRFPMPAHPAILVDYNDSGVIKKSVGNTLETLEERLVMTVPASGITVKNMDSKNSTLVSHAVRCSLSVTKDVDTIVSKPSAICSAMKKYFKRDYITANNIPKCTSDNIVSKETKVLGGLDYIQKKIIPKCEAYNRYYGAHNACNLPTP